MLAFCCTLSHLLFSLSLISLFNSFSNIRNGLDFPVNTDNFFLLIKTFPVLGSVSSGKLRSVA